MLVSDLHFSFQYFLKLLLFDRYHQKSKAVLFTTGMNGLTHLELRIDSQNI